MADSAGTGKVDVLLVNVDLPVGSLEPVWVFMQEGQVYRVEVTRDDVTLGFRTPARSIAVPFFSAQEGGSRPSGMSAFEIYPRADAMYEMRIVGGPYGAPTIVRVYRDLSASSKRQKIIATAGLEIGMEAAFGMHGAYPITGPSFSAPAPVGEAGANVALCFSVRGEAASRTRFSGCALGIGYEWRPDSESDLAWVFSEPRFRIVGKPGRSGFEAGVLTRVGMGIVSSVNVNPVLVAPGIYVSRQIRQDGARGGWNLTVSYARAWITGAEGAQSNRVTFGIGRF
jgi:hypothetical protein